MALTSALSEELDKLWMAQMVKASNAGGLGNATDLASGKAAAADIRKLGGGQVDGRYASGKADIRVLMGATTYGLADTLYPSNGDMSAVDSLQAETGGVRVSPPRRRGRFEKTGQLYPTRLEARWRDGSMGWRVAGL